MAVAIIAITVFNIFSKNSKEKVEIDQSFNHVKVETDNTDIVFISSDSAKVELENGNNEYNLNATVKGDTLEIEVDHKWFRFFTFDFFSKTPALKIYLPEKLAGSIKAETDNGTIHAAKITSNEFIVETDNGEVIMNDIKVKTLNVESDNGEVYLENIEGEIVGDSSNGDIVLILDTLNQPVNLETNNGTIIIQSKNEPQNVKIDVETDNGDIVIFGNSNASTVYGNGESLVKLKSDNGDIVVEK